MRKSESACGVGSSSIRRNSTAHRVQYVQYIQYVVDSRRVRLSWPIHPSTIYRTFHHTTCHMHTIRRPNKMKWRTLVWMNRSRRKTGTRLAITVCDAIPRIVYIYSSQQQQQQQQQQYGLSESVIIFFFLSALVSILHLLSFHSGVFLSCSFLFLNSIIWYLDLSTPDVELSFFLREKSHQHKLVILVFPTRWVWCDVMWWPIYFFDYKGGHYELSTIKTDPSTVTVQTPTASLGSQSPKPPRASELSDGQDCGFLFCAVRDGIFDSIFMMRTVRTSR